MIASRADMDRRARFVKVMGWTRQTIYETSIALAVPEQDLRGMLGGSVEVSQCVATRLSRWLGFSEAWLMNGVGEAEEGPTAVEAAILQERTNSYLQTLLASPQASREQAVIKALTDREALPLHERGYLYSALKHLFALGSDIRSALGQLALKISAAVSIEETICEQVTLTLLARNP
ncbi:MAG: hypothetical protein V4587_00310 [Acidobacteriota bacterium]